MKKIYQSSFLIILFALLGCQQTPETAVPVSTATTLQADLTVTPVLPTKTSVPPTATPQPPTPQPPSPTATPQPPATDDQPPATSDQPPATTVDIDLFLYKPRHITITAGTEVTWINHDAIQHTVTNGEPGNIGTAFDSDFFYQDETFTFVFQDVGEYTYFCQRHPHMIGTVTVQPIP